MSDTIISSEAASAKKANQLKSGWFVGRAGRKAQEATLAYILLLPAMIIIGLFGLFPLVFSVYQSTRAGLNNVVGRPDGLGQYIRAIDNLAYVLAFWVAIFFLVVGIQRLMGAVKTGRKYEESPWIWALPGGLTAVGLTLLLRFVFIYMPGLLEIGEKMRELRLTAEERVAQFPQFLREAWQVEGVSTTFWAGVLAIILSLVLLRVISQTINASRHRDMYYSAFVSSIFLLLIAGFLTWFTWSEIQLAYAEALAEGEALNIWAQVVTVSAGFILLLLAWLVWRSAAHRKTNLETGLRLFAGILLLIGGWVLIGELPAAVAEGNKDWWQGLTNTVFYAVGSLPIQLGLGLVVATLLYQDIKAKGLYRVIYFLPFITPAVGSAAVFRIIFSGNPTGLANTLLSRMDLAPMKWLSEPSGVFEMVARSLNIETFPDWAAGPSLALVVVMVYSIWRYVGYNIVFFLAGLGNISRELYEAASIDGAGRWEQFRNITVPLLSPVTYFLAIFGVIGTFKAFNTIFVLRTDAALGTMDTASLVIFDAFNRDTRYGYAAALGIVLLIIILSATALFDRIAQGRVFYG
ncbi:MAG: sugar ABC transporter permease [Ardenticatenaceae bacterium]|nr:sugar ABC transporter permease [Ardenticatenaceae bacterium]